MFSRIVVLQNFSIFAILFLQNDARYPESIFQRSDTVPGEFPYVISLRRYNHHLCGGVIISSWHILTAAHCFIDKPYDDGLVALTCATSSRAIGLAHKVKTVTLHTQFRVNKNNHWLHDIAVITLSEKIIFDHCQNPIALPNIDTPGNIDASLLGWGNTTWNGEESKYLKETKVHLLTNEKCNNKYIKDIKVTETQICGINGKGTGYCSGDSGSPLIFNNEVIGIVSYSNSCHYGGLDTYTRVFKYMNFITNIISNT